MNAEEEKEARDAIAQRYYKALAEWVEITRAMAQLEANAIQSNDPAPRDHNDADGVQTMATADSYWG